MVWSERGERVRVEGLEGGGVGGDGVPKGLHVILYNREHIVLF